MTFEEFFSKKKINLPALQSAEPSLFAEFKTHFEQMGEKSFDHTKKYWFNKLRKQYPAPAEIKTEKVKISNPLAEQTITESLEEQTAPSPKPGFTPRFKAAAMPKPETETEEKLPAEEKPTAAAPKPGFTPRFKAANTPKPAATPEEEIPAASAPKPGFTPRFKAANMPKAAEEKSEEKPATENSSAETPAVVSPKLGFTPKFKAVNLPQPADQPVAPLSEEKTAGSAPETPADEMQKADASKPAYKPRFNMKNIPKKEE